jgi:hypothetical protein
MQATISQSLTPRCYQRIGLAGRITLQREKRNLRPPAADCTRMHQPRLVLASLALIAGSAACGSDPVQYSDSVGINLKAKSSETSDSVVSDDKGITTESGNPFGGFVSDAQAQLDGADPSSVAVEDLELLLGGNSTGVVALGEIFEGDVDVLFEMNDTNNSFPVATATLDADTDAGPVGFDVSFDSDALGQADFDKLLAGSFKVVIRGAAAPDFETKGAEADLQLTFTFAAFE